MGGVDAPRASHGRGERPREDTREDREKAEEMKARVEEAAAALHVERRVSELSSGFEGAAGQGAGGGRNGDGAGSRFAEVRRKRYDTGVHCGRPPRVP